MGELVVVAGLKVKEGEEDRARDVLSQVAAASREEPGCIAYALHRAKDDPQRFVLIERWESQDALDEHYGRPHMKLVADNVDALAEPPQTWVCEAVPEGG